MKNSIVFSTLSAISAICLSQHAAHTHGIAGMTVVYDNQHLIVELQTPAANILGFEHEPRTEEEMAALSRVAELAQNPNALFELNPSCEPIDIDVDLPFADKLAGKDSHSNEHDHEHHKEEHAGHDHGDEHDHEGDEHKDIRLAYQWKCENANPPIIQVHVFDQFSGFETINSQWIDNGKQGSTRLNRDNNRLELR